MGKNHKKVLSIALAKIKRQTHCKNQWGGYLTPSEILELVKAGIYIEPFYRDSFEYIKERKKRGESEPTWFYFQLGKVKKLIPDPTK